MYLANPKKKFKFVNLQIFENLEFFFFPNRGRDPPELWEVTGSGNTGGGTHLEVDPSLDEVHLEDLVDVGEAAELALHVLLDETVVRRLRRTLDRHEVEVLDARRRDELLRHTHGRAGRGWGAVNFVCPLGVVITWHGAVECK